MFKDKIKFAKVEDIKTGVKIGTYMNGKILFEGIIEEITYSGNDINGDKYIGGYFKWSKDSKMSFSVNKHNKSIILI